MKMTSENLCPPAGEAGMDARKGQCFKSQCLKMLEKDSVSRHQGIKRVSQDIKAWS